MQCSKVAGLILILFLSAGCAGHKPFRAVAPEQRAGVRVVGVAPVKPYPYTPTGSHATSYGGGKRVNEAKIVAESVRERIRRLQSESGNARETAPTLQLIVASSGVAQLERGDFVGAFAEVWARLRNSENKIVWFEIARSTSTKARHRAEYEANPELYAEDFREAADDVARQLIDGPIR